MILFGRTLDPQAIASLVAMILALVFWLVVWKRERQNQQGFKSWNADRKARREAEAIDRGDTPPTPPSSGKKRGPWG